jgi:ppGpp synthetase/RelA/SpoT-type nucleotidyltranferase
LAQIREESMSNSKISRKLDLLLQDVSINAGEKEEDFFNRIENSLHNLCHEIAAEINADSAAIFFVTNEKFPVHDDSCYCTARDCATDTENESYLIMRGASGRLRTTYDSLCALWQERYRIYAATDNHSHKKIAIDDLKGFIFKKEKRTVTVTTDIWRTETGFIANSNQVLDKKRSELNQPEQGNQQAYPGNSLYTTFRSMIAVPIFVQGVRDYEPQNLPDNEFKAKYRFIGVLKVEGKRPLFDLDEAEYQSCEKKLAGLLDAFYLKTGVTEPAQTELRRWCQQKIQINMNTVFDDRPENEFPPCIKNHYSLCKGIADIFTRLSGAEFTRQDMELLVLLAMQIGRLMTLRVIKYAIEKQMILGENEVGFLNIKWDDINDLERLYQAARAALQKVRFCLETLKMDLDIEKRQEVFQSKISDLFDHRGPIREIEFRCKDYLSLMNKMMRKHQELLNDKYEVKLRFDHLDYTMKGFDNRFGANVIARGKTSLFMSYQNEKGIFQSKMETNLGYKNSIQINESVASVMKPEKKEKKSETFMKIGLALIKRILDVYLIDDLAGLRMIVNYESDLYEILEELKARCYDWQIEFGKVDDFLRDKKDDGYRGIHVTLKVDVKPLMEEGDYYELVRVLNPADGKLLIPVEIQLRPIYQHSWSVKTHGLFYKQAEKISRDFRDQQEILSNVLAEADWLSDIVRVNIEQSLLPSDYGERQLLKNLNHHLPWSEMVTVKFGLAGAKECLQDLLRYSGRPELSLTLEICERLFYSFNVTDSKMFLLALLRNIWKRNDGTGQTDRWFSENIDVHDDFKTHFYEQLRNTCPRTLLQYQSKIRGVFLAGSLDNSGEWLELWIDQFPGWFWALQSIYRDYFKMERENMRLQWKEHLRNIQEIICKYHQSSREKPLETEAEWVERAYIMETAIVLAKMTELPLAPGAGMRKRFYNDYLDIYRHIRNNMPYGPVKDRIVTEFDRAFRDIETKMDLPRQPEW